MSFFATNLKREDEGGKALGRGGKWDMVRGGLGFGGGGGGGGLIATPHHHMRNQLFHRSRELMRTLFSKRILTCRAIPNASNANLSSYLGCTSGNAIAIAPESAEANH